MAVTSSTVSKAISDRWWIAVVFALLVLAGSLYLYAGPSSSDRPAYKAVAAMRVTVLSLSPGDTYGNYQLHMRAASVARSLTDTVSGSATFAAEVARVYTQSHAQLRSLYGANIPDRLTQAQVEGSLNAAHSDSILTITTHWQTPAGAQALALAATRALERQASASTSGNTTGQDIMVVQPVSSVKEIPVSRDASVDGAAFATLLSRVAIGILTGVALAAALVVWDVRKKREAQPLPR